MGMMGTKSLTPYKKCEQHKGRSALPLRLLKNVRSKELNTHYDYGKSESARRVHKRRKALSDEELSEQLAQYAPLTDADFPEVSAEGYANFAKNQSGRVTKGLEKWL
jgi:hypothetical protein